MMLVEGTFNVLLQVDVIVQLHGDGGGGVRVFLKWY